MPVNPEAARLLVLGEEREDYHDFRRLAPVYRSFLKDHAGEMILSSDADALLPENIKDFDLILFFGHGENLTIPQHSGLQAAVLGSPWGRTGRPKGLLAIHGAAVYPNSQDDYSRMIGARFLAHPELGPSFSCSPKDHPVLEGIHSFEIIDELYLMDYTSPFQTLLSTTYQGFEVPLAWVKAWGRGKVFYCALGHDRDQISHPSFQKLLLNALHWARPEGF